MKVRAKSWNIKKSTATCRNKFIFLRFYPHTKVEMCFREKITVVRKKSRKRRGRRKALFCFFLVLLQVFTLFMWKRWAICDTGSAFSLWAGARRSDGVAPIHQGRAGHRSCKQHLIQSRFKPSEERERGTH